MNTTQEKQVAMHKNFFDRCQQALDAGFYMEAILMEYAAMESRLEVLLGVVGLPCNKGLDDKLRKYIKISHRIACAGHLRKKCPAFQNSKLPMEFFSNLSKWITKRDKYVHGLYKNEIRYEMRINESKEQAETGLMYCRALYNEVTRLRRMCKTHPEYLDSTVYCRSKGCKLMQKPDTDSGKGT